MQHNESERQISNWQEFLAEHQNQPITNPEIAEQIGEQQKEYIKGALNELIQILNTESKALNAILRLFDTFPDYLTEEDYKAAYECIHSSELNEQQKLALEFLVGLASFEQATRLSLEIFKKLNPEIDFKHLDQLLKEAEKKSIPDSLRVVEKIAYQLAESYHASYQGNSENFWLKVRTVLEENPELKQAAQALVSLRHIPEDPSILSIAQALHWQGFGGNGDMIKPFIGGISRQFIEWHADSEKTNHFSQRLGLFADAIETMKDHANQATTSALLETFPDEDTIRIIDVGSGPAAKGIATIAKRLSEQGKQVEVAVSDIDASNLAATFNLEPTETGFKIIDRRLLDLTGDLNPAGQEDKYHLFSASVVMHQITTWPRSISSCDKICYSSYKRKWLHSLT